LNFSVSEEIRVKILKFFEALHMELLMYTSCGWFFADISGIETIQNLKYANQLLFLMDGVFDEDVKKEFLQILSKAKSNIPEYENGRIIFEDIVEKNYLNLERILFEYVLRLKSSQNNKEKSDLYYYYRINIQEHKSFLKNSFNVERYLLESINTLTGEKRTHILLVVFFDRNYYGFVKKYKDSYFLKYIDKIVKDSSNNLLQELKDFLGSYYTLRDISQDAREVFLRYLFNDKMKKLHKFVEFSKSEFLSYLDVIELYGELKIHIPETHRLVVRELLNNFVLQEVAKIESVDIEKYDFSLLIRTISISKKAELELNYADILPVIRNFVTENMEDAIIKLEVSTLKKLDKIIDIANLSGIDFEKYEIQNLIFEKIKEVSKNRDHLKRNEVKLLLELARKFNIGVEEII
ncbi:MAG: DUF3536 domain-containing protein, partial [Brevinematia bacterium]